MPSITNPVRHKQFHDARTSQTRSEQIDIASFDSMALGELIANIDEASSLDDTEPVFRLADHNFSTCSLLS